VPEGGPAACQAPAGTSSCASQQTSAPAIDVPTPQCAAPDVPTCLGPPAPRSRSPLLTQPLNSAISTTTAPSAARPAACRASGRWPPRDGLGRRAPRRRCLRRGPGEPRRPRGAALQAATRTCGRRAAVVGGAGQGMGDEGGAWEGVTRRGRQRPGCPCRRATLLRHESGAAARAGRASPAGALACPIPAHLQHPQDARLVGVPGPLKDALQYLEGQEGAPRGQPQPGMQRRAAGARDPLGDLPWCAPAAPRRSVECCFSPRFERRTGTAVTYP
jgi:hypothetical protein